MTCSSATFTVLTCALGGAALHAAPSPAPAPIDFSWRAHQGDFPKDKPGYLILVTEDALAYSKVLPEFVKQKEKVGFRVYVATEKDYGSGKTGNAQGLYLRAWLRKFRERTNARYALFIGDCKTSSANLPAMHRAGAEASTDEGYRDLDGKCNEAGDDWFAAAILERPIPKATLPRTYELLMSRIAYAGDEIGNGAYDLDRILAKTIRYENETLAGKNLDWRGRMVSVISNYGGSGWDGWFKDYAEQAGVPFEHHSTSWHMANCNFPIPEMIPENYHGVWPRRFTLQQQMFFKTRPYGLMTTMSHASNRGSEGITGQADLLSEMDDRHPSVVGVTGCTAFSLGDNCNLGQSHLRRGAIFSFGTPWSGNNGQRLTLMKKLLEDRDTIGESFSALGAGLNLGWYGDPSLRVLPPKGEPLAALQVSPSLGSHYEERTMDFTRPIKPVIQTYAVTNRSKLPMTVEIASDANWFTPGASKLEIQPGKSAEVEVRTNGAVDRLPAGAHRAAIRFRNPESGHEEERRLSLILQPLALASYHSFDAEVVPPAGRRPKSAKSPATPVWFRDWAMGDFLGSIQSNAGLITLSPARKGKARTPAPDPTMFWEPDGKIGGALRFNGKGQPLMVSTQDYLSWRGFSASFWIKLDALPTAKKPLVLLQAPLTLTVNAKGELSMVRDGAPVAVGAVTAGAWHWIRLRSDLGRGQVMAALDDKTEVACAFPEKFSLGNRLVFTPFAGCLDEVKIWSGEGSASDRAAELRAAAKTVSVANPVPGLRALAPVDSRLEWRPVNRPEKARFQVYLGESEASVAAATPAGSPHVLMTETAEPAFTPTLVPDKTYYWRVDVAGEAAKGPVWSFKTRALPYRILRPVAEGSASVAPRIFMDPHRGQLLRTPTLYSFQVPAGVDAAKAYLYVKGFSSQWQSMPEFALYKIDGDLDGWAGGGANPETYKNAAKKLIVNGGVAHGGNWLDVSAHLTPGKRVCFALETTSRADLTFFSLTNSEARGFFGGDHIAQPVTPKLVFFAKDAPPVAIVDALPKAVDFTETRRTADLGAALPKSSASLAVTFSLQGAPDWAQISPDGKVSLRDGVRFDDLDFGGYDSVLRVRLADGQTFERPFKIRIPVPGVRIKMSRSQDGMLAFLSATATPLAKGVIRYTTDGSPVKADSPVYKAPFRLTEGMKPVARFFYLGEYPMAPVTLASEVGVSRADWRATGVSGNPATLSDAPDAFDGRLDTAWSVENPKGFPQHLSWDMGEEISVAALLCQSNIRDSGGRVKDYALYAGDDGKTWKKVQSGTLPDTPVPQRIDLPASLKARHLKLEATSLHKGKAMTLTEVEVYTR